MENKFPYLCVSTFYKFKHAQKLKNVDAALAGAPFDQGTTNRQGTRYGQRAIRMASQNSVFTIILKNATLIWKVKNTFFRR